MSISFKPNCPSGFTSAGLPKRGETALRNKVRSSLSAKTSIHGLMLSVRIGLTSLEKTGDVSVWDTVKENLV